jgi:hypothetical protein
MNRSIIPVESVTQVILVLRGQKVILDADLARLYGVQTKAFNQAVRRNLSRFPPDFMFQLTPEEFRDLRSQNVTSSEWGGRRYPPYAFTEHGAVMATTILKTEQAASVSVYVVRAFVQLRDLLATHTELAHKLEELERKLSSRLDAHDEQISLLMEAIRQLMVPPEASHRCIGFRSRDEEE